MEMKSSHKTLVTLWNYPTPLLANIFACNPTERVRNSSNNSARMAALEIFKIIRHTLLLPKRFCIIYKRCKTQGLRLSHFIHETPQYSAFKMAAFKACTFAPFQGST
jgi:hypothetical protein